MNNPGAGGKRGNGSGPTASGKSAREKRVELLKEKVGKGTFRVNAWKVAEKMVGDALRAIRSRDTAK